MLQSIRDRASGWLAGLLVVLISIPFALWGINRYFGGGGEEVVAKVNGQEISANAFQREYQQRYTQIQQAYGDQFDPSMINQGKFKQQVLESMIRSRLIAQHIHDAGFAITSQELANQIESIPAFQKNGKFSEKLYRERLQQQGYSPSQFEQKLRNAIEIDQLRTGVLGSAVVTRQDVDAYVRMRYQKRKVSYLEIAAKHFLGQVKVSDSQVQSYYHKHRSDYMTPERVRLKYVELSPQGVAKSVKVTQSDLKQYYHQHIQRYTTPPRRHALHILIKPKNGNDAAAHKKAEQIRNEALSGKSFRKLARKYSDDAGSAKQGGDLGWVSPGEMVKPFDKALFHLKKGQISKVVKTRFGYHIIKLVGVQPKHTKPFDQVRDQVEQSYRQHQAKSEMYDLGQKLANVTFEQPDSLQPAAKKLGLKIRETGWITREGGKGIGQNDKVIKAAFKPQVLKQGMNSDPIQLKDGKVLVVRVAEHQKAQQEPLAQVHDRIASTLRRQEAEKKAKEKGQAILHQEDGNWRKLSSFQSMPGLSYHDPGAIERDDQKLDSALVQTIFRMPRPQGKQPAVSGVKLSSGDYAVVALHKVSDGNPATLGKEKLAKTREQLGARQGNAEFDAYVQALRDKGNVTEYKSKLQ
ncbi:MAG TPA: SurA N-terminal domain-containing protein [Gammaproteobacteria bacterium]|nr:SurA N-terminal domain-containing protein [Gammaproteobacteria bacterium]